MYPHTVCKPVVDGQNVIVGKDAMKNKTNFRTMPLLPETETLLLETIKAGGKPPQVPENLLQGLSGLRVCK